MAGAVLACGAGLADAANLAATWSNPVSGTWSNNTLWSGGVVPNNAADTYSVTIGAPGPAYTVTLNTTTTINDLTISAPGATLLHNFGTFSVVNSAINLQAGTYQIAGGVLSNSSINFNGGTLSIASGAIFNNVAVNGSLNLSGAGARLGLRGNNAISGTLNIGGSSGGVGFFDSVTAPAITYNLDAPGAFMSLEGSGTATLPAGATVRGGNNGGFWYGYYTAGNTNGLINNGTIRADLANSAFILFPSGNNQFTNNGRLDAINGATLTISAATWNNSATGSITATNSNVNFFNAWSNSGSIHVTNSHLRLGGTFTTSSLSNITRSGGTVSIIGAWNNAGSGYTFSAANGAYLLSGGSISGGSLNFSGGTLAFGSGASRLDNVDVNGSLTLDIGSGRVLLSGATTIDGPLSITGNGAIVGLLDSAVAPATTYNLDGSSTYLSVEGAGTATLPAGTLVRGGNNGGIWYGFMSGGFSNGLINNGTIRADISARTFLLFPTGNNTLTNNGTIEATNNGTMAINAPNWTNSAAGRLHANNGTLILGGNWSNAGSILVNNGTLIAGGTFSTSSLSNFSRTGGTVLISGSWNNASSGFNFNATTGEWLLAGGTVTGGSLTFAGASLGVGTNGSGILSNVTVNGSITLSNSSSKLGFVNPAPISGPVTLAANGSALGFFDTQTMPATTYNLDGVSTYISTEGAFGTLTIPAAALVRGGNGGGFWHGFFTGGPSNSLVNNGTIRADISGGTFTIFQSGTHTFVNNGTLQAINGGKLIARMVSGSVNHVRVDGLNSLISLDGTYTINQPIAAVNRGTLYLRGDWTKSADIDASGRIVFDYPSVSPSPFDSLRAQILTGRAGGSWNGPGINSSAAAITPGTGVGYGEAAALYGELGGIFAGQAVDGSAVLVRYTYFGDADLDGDVDGIDVGRWAQAFTGELGGAGTAVWTDGDWDYDGDVDGIDVGLWAQNFTGELGGAGLSDVTVAWPTNHQAAELLQALGITLVPEPATLLAVALLAPMALRSRRGSRRR